MKPLPHHYDSHLTGGPSGHAQVSAGGLPALRAAPPVEYDGPGDAWSPEHLLLASIQTCFFVGLRGSQWASGGASGQRGQKRGDDLELQVLLVPIAIRASL